MKHNKKKRSKIISFDAETITKEGAETISNSKRINDNIADTCTNEHKQEKGKKDVPEPKSKQTEGEEAKETIPKSKKRKRSKILNPCPQENVKSVSKEESTESTQKPSEESIRAKKRKKHAKLLEEKKLKAELAMQQKCLNYLSLWKHNRQEWKFEKLRQVWLQQNLYNKAKIPDEFWDVLVQYFSNSKGKARDTIIKDAIKIVEQEDTEPVEETDKEDFTVKLSRARNIIQNLQE